VMRAQMEEMVGCYCLYWTLRPVKWKKTNSNKKK
jgi:hypothetical protein